MAQQPAYRALGQARGRPQSRIARGLGYSANKRAFRSCRTGRGRRGRPANSGRAVRSRIARDHQSRGGLALEVMAGRSICGGCQALGPGASSADAGCLGRRGRTSLGRPDRGRILWLGPPVPATTLQELAALARRARLFVSSDTGPLHLAAAVGTPCVGLFGPMPAECNGPYGPGQISVQTVCLAGSSRSRCRANNDSMRAISVEQVTKACDEIVGRTADRRCA